MVGCHDGGLSMSGASPVVGRYAPRAKNRSSHVSIRSGGSRPGTPCRFCFTKTASNAGSQKEACPRRRRAKPFAAAALPTVGPDRRSGETGIGELCAVCGERIGRNQMEMELEFNRHGATPGIDRYHLHPRGYAAWESQRIE